MILNNSAAKAIEIFNQLKPSSIQSNIIIYLLTINALSQLGHISLCEPIMKRIPDSVLDNHEIKNALVDMWVSLNLSKFSFIRLIKRIKIGKSGLC